MDDDVEKLETRLIALYAKDAPEQTNGTDEHVALQIHVVVVY